MKNYKMKVTVTMTVYDVEANDDRKAMAIVYDMFKGNDIGSSFPYGVVEEIDSEVLEEEDIDEEEDDE